MSAVIVPNCVRDAINQKLDTLLLNKPDAAVDREIFFYQLLAYYDQHGVIPDCEVTKSSVTAKRGTNAIEV